MAIKYTPFLLISFLGGVLFRSFFAMPDFVLLAILGVALGFTLIEYFIAKPGLAVFVVIIFLFGTLRLSFFEEQITRDELHNHYGETLTIQGTIINSERTMQSERLVLSTDQGKLLVIKRRYPSYSYGDVLQISGTLTEPTPSGKFDRKKYLSKDHIYTEMLFPEITHRAFDPPSKILAMLFWIKGRFQEQTKSILPEPHASLANGMLLGKEDAFDPELYHAFQKSGTAHILVLSGYNITIVGIFIITILGLVVPFRVAWAGSLVGIILFTLMTGAEAPAVRAAIMAIIALLARQGGRLHFALLALLWSAFFMVLVNPMVLRWDRGFQLSALATMGLIVASPFFMWHLRFLPKILGARESGAATFAAQLFVLPLLLSWGNEISLFSPIANILIVSMVPAVMLFSFLGGITAFFSSLLGQVVASVAYLLISFQILIAQTVVDVPLTSIAFNGLPVAILCAIYSILFWWAIKQYTHERKNDIL